MATKGPSNQSMPQPARSPAPTPISEETLKALLEVQSRELALRSKELDLRLRETDANSAHAEKILHVQERDREAERNHQRRMSRGRLVLGGAIVMVLAALVVVGMLMNKDALVKDIIQIVGSATLGALGGYGLGIRKRGVSDDSSG